MRERALVLFLALGACRAPVEPSTPAARERRVESTKPLASPPVVEAAPAGTPVSDDTSPSIATPPAFVDDPTEIEAPVGEPTPSPDSAERPRGECCRVCRTGKACGNSCISAERRCTRPPGCACDE